MKTKVHLRVAYDKRRRKTRIEANVRPSNAPLLTSAGDYLPTVAFALVLDIPDGMFERAEQVIAELTIPESETRITTEVKHVDHG